VKPPASRIAAVISVAVQNRFGTTSATVRTRPSRPCMMTLTCSLVTCVTGSMTSRGPPQRTLTVPPSTSLVHSLLVRRSAKRSAGCTSSAMYKPPAHR
jgi:hypothetical protein